MNFGARECVNLKGIGFGPQRNGAELIPALAHAEVFFQIDLLPASIIFILPGAAIPSNAPAIDS
jgi:hypothetical protein